MICTASLYGLEASCCAKTPNTTKEMLSVSSGCKGPFEKKKKRGKLSYSSLNTVLWRGPLFNPSEC